MLIELKNKDTLIFDDFKLKCSIGKSGIKKNKFEGDKSTPKGIYKLGKLFWRKDRVKKPVTKLITKKINKKMAWCTDSNSKFYNKEIKIKKNIKHEKLFRKDYKYNYFILVKYNYNKSIKKKGSAIFIHLTKNYKKTAGCITLSEKDFLILAKVIKKNTFIKIS